MVDILNRVGVEGAGPEKVYEALTTVDGLAGWWTDDTSGNPGEVGGKIEFRFPPGGIDMEVVELQPSERVVWKCIDGAPEWIGTTIEFQLREARDNNNDRDFTIVMFKHAGWKEPVEFMYHCSTKWATFLVSLKQLVETGEGAPAPRDLHIAFPD